MMTMEILEEFPGCNDHMIVQGKRTKRPTLWLSSSTSSNGGVGGGEFYSLVSSPTTSTSTEEEEDMANCLILLSRGGFPEKIKSGADKFRTRKFTDMATAINGKVGIYVYECKTCNRTFPSFQALGGHTASHKKPKPTIDNDQKKSLSPPPDGQEDEERPFTILNTITPPPSTQLPNKSCHIENNPKIYECSICGSEFASGQALGGHMRRHRSAAAPPYTSTKIGTSVDSDSPHDGDEKPRKMLTLDLNLPAPPEDDHRNTKFKHFPSSQQPQLIISAARHFWTVTTRGEEG